MSWMLHFKIKNVQTAECAERGDIRERAGTTEGTRSFEKAWKGFFCRRGRRLTVHCSRRCKFQGSRFCVAIKKNTQIQMFRNDPGDSLLSSNEIFFFSECLCYHHAAGIKGERWELGRNWRYYCYSLEDEEWWEWQEDWLVGNSSGVSKQNLTIFMAKERRKTQGTLLRCQFLSVFLGEKYLTDSTKETKCLHL